MTHTNSDRDRRIAELAEQFGFTAVAVQHLLQAIVQGGGDMAMFNHHAFGGPGQWIRGGMIMITDFNNHALKDRIDGLCNALSEWYHQNHSIEPAESQCGDPAAHGWGTVATAPRRWWPDVLGEPVACGEQNGVAYAYFDAARRLAIRRAGQVAVFDTGEHRITGTAQSQDSATGSSVVFTSQLGRVPLAELAPVERITPASAPARDIDVQSAGEPRRQSSDEILDAIERLGALHRKGLLTDQEFADKKKRLLARL